MRHRQRKSRRPSSFETGFESLEDRTVPSVFGSGENWEVAPATTFPSVDGYMPISSAPGVDLDYLRTTYGLDGSGYTVAVIDSGVDYLHPALGGGFGPGARVIDGYDFVDGRDGQYREADGTPGPDADPMDEAGHGTSVAGILASNDDVHEGVASGVNLVALRVLDADSRGRWAWVYQALDWVIEHREEYNIVAVNLSLGDGSYDQTPTARTLDVEPRLIQLHDAGVIVVASAGNEYAPGGETGIQYPAVSSSVISVGAVHADDNGRLEWQSGAIDYTTDADRVAAFSQRGSSLDLLAPGAIIQTTNLSMGGNENYIAYAGTSQAAPFVTGAAVLLHEALISTGQSHLATPDFIRQTLKSTGVSVFDGDDEDDNVSNSQRSYPRLDIAAAIDAVIGDVPDPQTGTPIDEYEPNDSQNQAASLGTQTNQRVDSLTWHNAADVDWFLFSVNEQTDYELRAHVPSGVPAPTFILHDVTANRERDLFTRVVDGVATIEAALRDGVNYFLEVRAPLGWYGSYSLSFVVAGHEVPPPSGENLTPDAHEPNETMNQAAFLDVLHDQTLNGLNWHTSSDADWFAFQAAVQTDHSIRVTVGEGIGIPTLILHDITKNRERTLYAQVVDGAPRIDVDLRTGVWYFLEIRPPQGESGEYQLDVYESGHLPAAQQLPVPPDSHESNETQNGASFVGVLHDQTLTNLTWHSAGDVDWYAFQAKVETDHSIRVPSSTGGARVVFHDISKGRERDIAARIVDGVAVVDVDLRVGVWYFLEIRPPANQTGTYDLQVFEASHAPPIGSDPVDPTIPDAQEPDESMGEAAFIGNISTLGSLAGTIHNSTDVDWLRFHATDETYTITARVTSATGEVRFTYRDFTKNKQRTLTATTVGGVATLEVPLRAGVNYYLKIESPDGQPVAYELSFDAAPSSASVLPADDDQSVLDEIFSDELDFF